MIQLIITLIFSHHKNSSTKQTQDLFIKEKDSFTFS